MKVAQEEEEERQRRQQQEMWRHHEDRCLALGLDPSLTAAFDPQTGYPCFFDPASGTWQAYPPRGWKTFSLEFTLKIYCIVSVCTEIFYFLHSDHSSWS
jgi:hypothetical protein